MDTLLDRTNLGVGGLYSQGHSCTGDTVSTGTADKRSLGAKKAESNVGFQWRDFPRPCKALVRGARSKENNGKN